MVVAAARSERRFSAVEDHVATQERLPVGSDSLPPQRFRVSELGSNRAVAREKQTQREANREAVETFRRYALRNHAYALVNRLVCSGKHARKNMNKTNGLETRSQSIHSVQQYRVVQRRRLGRKARVMAAHGTASIIDAWGVEPKAAPGGQDGQICGMSDGGIDAGEPGGGEPPRRLSGGRCGRSRRQSCAARCRRRGRKCPHWCGHDCTARCGAKCGRAPQERPHECSERCAKRRREENAAVVPTMPSNAAPTVAVRHAAVSEASRRASGARSDRRERRREGYPPEGARPRSGLDRVARSRSDAPSLIVWLTALVSILGTAISITVCTVVSIGVTGIGLGIATNISDVIGGRGTLSSSVARR